MEFREGDYGDLSCIHVSEREPQPTVLMSYLKKCVDYVSFDQAVKRMTCCKRINREKKAPFIIHQKMLVLGVGTAEREKNHIFFISFSRRKKRELRHSHSSTDIKRHSQ